MSGPRFMAMAVCGVLALALSAAAAGKSRCGPNEELRGGRCVPVKKAAQARDAGTAANAGSPAAGPGAHLVPAGASAAQATAKQAALVARGLELYRTQVCVTCHSIDGSVSTGPTFLGLYGKLQKLRDGSTVTVDDAYIRESILNPGAKVADGFLPLMPSYSGRLEDDEIDALVAWLKTVK